MLVESSLRGSSLVKQILTFARGVDGQRTVLKLQHILVETIGIARQTFPKSIVILTGSANEISLDLPVEDLWMVCVDATQIHQVFMNLFLNARDALPDGGSITATATNLVIDDTTAKLDINLRAGSYVVITVADTGVGIDSKAIDLIFDAFFTTKEMGTSDGVEAIALYERDWENITMVLLDMMMPNLHTPYIIRALQRINPAVKFGEDHHGSYSHKSSADSSRRNAADRIFGTFGLNPKTFGGQYPCPIPTN